MGSEATKESLLDKIEEAERNIEALKAELDAQSHRYHEIFEKNIKIESELKSVKHNRDYWMDQAGVLSQKLDEKEKESRFLSGQIEAYQYCMNCRR